MPNIVDTRHSDALKNSLFPLTIPEWNSISPLVVNFQTTEEFMALSKIQRKDFFQISKFPHLGRGVMIVFNGASSINREKERYEEFFKINFKKFQEHFTFWIPQYK